jgi:hypothetical protein
MEMPERVSYCCRAITLRDCCVSPVLLWATCLTLSARNLGFPQFHCTTNGIHHRQVSIGAEVVLNVTARNSAGESPAGDPVETTTP